MDTETATLELQTSIGETESSADYQFAAIVALLVTDDQLWVVDGYNTATPQARIFSTGGRFLRHVGSVGSGPGEYRSPNALTELPDGRVVMTDQKLTDRLTIYSSAGILDTTWRLGAQHIPHGQITTDTAGVVWVGIRSRPGPDRFIAYLRVREGVTVDTVRLPELPHVPSTGVHIKRRLPSGGLSVTGVNHPYAAAAVWALRAGGQFATARTDEYRIEILPRDGATTETLSIIVSREVPPVPVSEEERAAIRADLVERLREIGGTQAVPEVPKYKPPLKRIHFSGDGQLLVSVAMPSRQLNGEWMEPTAYDVFDVNGHFRGRIHVPDQFTIGYLRRDELWGVWRDPEGVESVRHYTVRWPTVGS